MARDAAGKFLTRHRRQLFGFEDQLLSGRAVRSDNATKCADITNVANESAGIDIPDDRDFVAIQIELGGFGGAPVRGDLRELAHNERFDVGTRRFFVVQIRADIADVRIGEADDLTGVAGIGENFLITGEAGIENDFTAAARNRASSASIKDAPVFECESGGPVRNFGQIVLPA